MSSYLFARAGSSLLLHRPSRLILSALTIALCLGGRGLPAQEITTQPGGVATLHVYTNLVQIPALVLSHRRDRLSMPIAADRFSISLGNGPSFRPVYAHQEGEDPIDLAIVLDARSAQEDLLPKIDQAIADLAPNYLHAQDRVSIYGLDCGTLHLVVNVPAEPTQLKNAVDIALSGWIERRENHGPPCTRDTHLRDVLTYVTDRLSREPGRRALLAVTDGSDQNSVRTMNDLTTLAQIDGVAIFGITHSWQAPAPVSRGAAAAAAPVQTSEDILAAACERSGGLMMDLRGTSIDKKLQWFTQVLRERYIIEFPRPNAQAGKLVVSIKIDRADDFIRIAGDGVPVAKPTETANANTISTDSSVAAQPDQQAKPAPVAAPDDEPLPKSK